MKSALDYFMEKMGYENCADFLSHYSSAEYKGKFYHYTSSAGLQSILNGREDQLTLWASRFDCLNDKMEGKLCRTIFYKVCEEMEESQKIDKTFCALLKTVAPTRTALFRNVGCEKRTTRPEIDLYITSLSRQPDALAMWNYYSKGKRYDGRNIELSAQEVGFSLSKKFQGKEISFKIMPVIYDVAEQKRLISDCITALYQARESNHDDTPIRALISMALTHWSLIFKNECFQHEAEIRIIVDVAKRRKNGILQSSPIAVKYRDSDGYIIPYVELALDKNALKSVTLAPMDCDNEEQKLQKLVLKEMLERYGYVAEANISQIPVRY